MMYKQNLHIIDILLCTFYQHGTLHFLSVEYWMSSQFISESSVTPELWESLTLARALKTEVGGSMEWESRESLH